ncbi:MAG: hypothetical protein ACT4QA_00310 [Panacagrimonas sp.]
MKREDFHKLPPIARAKAMHTRLPVDRRAHLIGLVVALLIVAAGLGYVFLWPGEVRTVVVPPPATPGIVYLEALPPAGKPVENQAPPAGK